MLALRWAAPRQRSAAPVRPQSLSGLSSVAHGPCRLADPGPDCPVALHGRKSWRGLGRFLRLFFLPKSEQVAIRAPFYFVTWPRISPPLFFSVWTLKYSFPASSSSAWASVRVAVPFIGLATLP
jgi:hypothetical protein